MEAATVGVDGNAGPGPEGARTGEEPASTGEDVGSCETQHSSS